MKLLYIKSGIAIGGASILDLSTLKELNDFKQLTVDIVSGYIDNHMHRMIKQYGYNLEIIPELDRLSPQNESTQQKLYKQLLHKVLEYDVVFISQPLLGDNNQFNMILPEIIRNSSAKYLLRLHNHVRDENETKLISKMSNAFFLPISNAISAKLNSFHVTRTLELPFFFDASRYTSIENVSNPNMFAREFLGIEKDAIVLFQPTRVSNSKRIGKSLDLAIKLENSLKKKVYLVVAGGSEPTEESQFEKIRLEKKSRLMNYNRIVFLGGLSNSNAPLRVSDYLNPNFANIITFMSKYESFGLPPMEAAYCRIPCVSTAYTDEMGMPIFNNIYKEFKFIVDDLSDDNSVNDQTVNDVIKILTNTRLRKLTTEYNRQIVEMKYGKRQFIETFSRILIDES